MSIKHIPNGFTSVTPYFICTNAAAFIEFIEAAFEAEKIDLTIEDEQIRHFTYRIWGSMVEGSQANDDYGATKISIHLYVSDCDAIYRRAISAGGKSIHEVADMPYGERSGGILDPCGNSWWIATQTSDMYPEI